MKLKKNIAISESGFIFNPNNGDSFSANPMGLMLVEMLKLNLSEENMKKKIMELYNVDEDQLDEDIYDFINHLKQLNLLQSEKD